MISFQGCDGIELLDWLFDQNDGILRHEEPGHHGNHHIWPIQDPNVRLAVGPLMSLTHATNNCLLCIYCTVVPPSQIVCYEKDCPFTRHVVPSNRQTNDSTWGFRPADAAAGCAGER